jgi:hypothetical protein
VFISKLIAYIDNSNINYNQSEINKLLATGTNAIFFFFHGQENFSFGHHTYTSNTVRSNGHCGLYPRM